MANPCDFIYNGNKYRYNEFRSLLANGELDRLIKDGHITISEKPITIIEKSPILKKQYEELNNHIDKMDLSKDDVSHITELLTDKNIPLIADELKDKIDVNSNPEKISSQLLTEIKSQNEIRKSTSERPETARQRKESVKKADRATIGETTEPQYKSIGEQNGKGGADKANSVEENYKKSFADYNKIKDVVIKKEERLKKMEDDGKRDTPEFEKELAAWRKAVSDKKILREQLRKSETEFTKSQAEKFRKNKINTNEDRNLYGVTPPAVLLKAAKDLGVRLYNAAIETIALSMEAGKSIQHAIQDGVDYINERFHAGKWDEEGFKKAIAPINIIQNTPEDIRAAKVEQNPLSQKNKQLVNSMVDLVKNNTESLSSINRKIDNLSLSPTMKEKIKKYIETKIGNETFKIKGNELSDKFLQQNNNNPKKALEELNKEEDMMLKSTDNPNEQDNISNEFVYARANLKAKEAQLNEKPTGIPNEPPPSEDPAGEKPDEQVILPEYTKTTEAKILWQNQLKRLEQYVEERTKKFGQFLDDSQDPWIRLTLKHDVAANKIKEKENWKEDFLKRMHSDNISLSDIGEYAYAKHAPEANAHIAKIRQQTVEAKLLDLEKELKNTKTDKAKENIEKEIKDIQEQKDPNFALMSDGGSGMENAESEAVIKKVADEGKTELYDNYLKEFKDNVITPLLDERYDAGLIDKDTYNHLKSYYKDYVPTKIDQDVYNEMKQQNEETIQKGNKKNRIQDTQAQLLRRKGSKEFRYTERNNPIIQAFSDYDNVIIAGENNKAYKVLADEIEAHPNPHIWHVERAQYDFLRDDAGNIIKAFPKKVPDNSIAFYDNGEKNFIVMNDSGMQQIPRKVPIGSVVRAASKVNRWLASVRTSKNPEFILANPIFDASDARVTLSASYPEAGKKFASYYRNIKFPKLLAEINGWKKGNEWTPYVNEVKKYGGLITFGDVLNPKQHAENLEKLYESFGKKGGAAARQHLGKVVENAVTSLEQMTRVMVYRAMRETGNSPEKSAIMARNATIDFGKKGVYGPYLGAFQTFLNAKIQSTANAMYVFKQATPDIQALKSGKIIAKSSLKVANAARKSLTALFLGGIAQSIIARLLNDDSTEVEDHYGEIPEYRKQSKMLIPMKMFGGKGYAQIDLPKNFNSIWYAGAKFGDNIINKIKGDDTHIASDAKDILISAHNNYDPFLATNNIQDAAFGNFSFVPQLANNKNSLNQPIWPENKPGLRDYETYRENTPSLYKNFSKALYNMIGADIHPDAWEYWANQIGGGVYTTGKDAIITGKDIVQGEPVNPNTIPVSHRFYSNSGMAGTKERVSNAMEKAQQQGLSAEEYTKAINDITTLYDNGIWSAEKAKRVQSKLERTTKEATQNRAEADYKEATEE